MMSPKPCRRSWSCRTSRTQSWCDPRSPHRRCRQGTPASGQVMHWQLVLRGTGGIWHGNPGRGIHHRLSSRGAAGGHGDSLGVMLSRRALISLTALGSITHGSIESQALIHPRAQRHPKHSHTGQTHGGTPIQWLDHRSAQHVESSQCCQRARQQTWPSPAASATAEIQRRSTTLMRKPSRTHENAPKN